MAAGICCGGTIRGVTVIGTTLGSMLAGAIILGTIIHGIHIIIIGMSGHIIGHTVESQALLTMVM